ncbi:sensor domain-containing protein [Dactylosporangium aurantiacum]|uniref:histidine kinase n=1 Tax=Dactylosporangium aurantiacum TaxID=35754 RepID=A0A9Q9IBF7_9ACTN|nr:sensor histidine kinase [Dactylosporangium aurantiacum]MDG6109523.1 sensor domain-containing protein [Dactylosporangium aurantiacum]UWZ51320.1 sensor domain-containing protein [Dactylosporangium aurantiacum]
MPGSETVGDTGRGRRYLRHRTRLTVDALEHLVGGLGTAVLALGAALLLVVVAAACLAGIGLLMVPSALRLVRAAADRERARLSRWETALPLPPPIPAGLRDALREPWVRRDTAFVAVHGTAGFCVGLLGVSLPLSAVQYLLFPLYWWLLPPDAGGPGLVYWRIDGLLGAFAVFLIGVGWLAVSVALVPRLARLQAAPGRRLLAPPRDVDVSLRIAELTATRAAALDAHAVELRRIERSLHDGAQNRLVAVTVLLGAARRALARDPAVAGEILDRAHDAAELALAELRTVVRGILPPVLDDRGLAGALDGLAAGCGVPCTVEVDVPGRCAASVEATAYFVVAEALTNVARHSGAATAAVTVRRDGDRLHVRVADDGRGGADEGQGSGIGGIRRRVEAHDGRFTLTSPPGGPTTILVELPCGS